MGPTCVRFLMPCLCYGLVYVTQHEDVVESKGGEM